MQKKEEFLEDKGKAGRKKKKEEKNTSRKKKEDKKSKRKDSIDTEGDGGN